jgi:DNA end-binding protein Ku
MTTLLRPDEVRDTEGIAPKPIELRPDEVAHARQLMDTISAEFDPEQERDEHTVALREVVEARMADLPAPHVPEAKVLPLAAGVTDLMAVLQAAVGRAQEEHPKAAARRPAKKSAAKKAARGHHDHQQWPPRRRPGRERREPGDPRGPGAFRANPPDPAVRPHPDALPTQGRACVNPL